MSLSELQSPRSPGSCSSQKARGICSVCHVSRLLHIKDGNVHLHGPRSNPCLGSNRPPISHPLASDLPLTNSQPNETLTTTGTSNNAQRILDTNSRDHLKHPSLQHNLLRHIPKGARSSTGLLLVEVINRLLSKPTELDNWKCLLSFGAFVLEQPRHGGRRHNITSTIKKRTSEFFNSWHTKADEIFGPAPNSHSINHRKKLDSDQSIAAAVATKLEDGNISAAAKILCSGEAPAPVCEQTFAELQAKHPSPPADSPPIPTPPLIQPIHITETAIRNLIRTFPAGSAGGPDGLRPQHILEMIKSPDAGPALISAITALVNLLLAGTCHEDLRPLLFGGTLFALRKKSGGLRPIVIGYFWRRLASKGANDYAVPRLKSYLSPRQVGVGTPGGTEAAVHATRRFLQSMDTDSILVKLDISNAFNSLSRTRMMTAVNDLIPEIAPYCHLAYAEMSQLQYGTYTIQSRVGPQQGDPLGPLLFCLPLQPILLKLSSPLAFSYLDDISLGGPIAKVAADCETLEKECAALDLTFNKEKCELIAKDFQLINHSSFKHFGHTDLESAMLLGAPLSTGAALQQALESRAEELDRALSRLHIIARQEALLILRHSLGTPKLIHTLRCAPCVNHPCLATYDEILRKGLQNILNIDFTDMQWQQSTLPIRMGGLGIRRASSLALPAFIASAASTSETQSNILCGLDNLPDMDYTNLSTHWQAITGIPLSENFPAHIQANWDTPILHGEFSKLLESTTELCEQARLKAVSFPHASDWLHALPITPCGLRLSDEAIRVAVGLRLGANICQPHTCACGTLVTARGAHGLSCVLGFGRVARHAAINDLIYRSLVKAGFPAVKEPPGMLRSDGRRPDGTTLIPWRAGRSLVWDATVVDTLAQSYLHATATTAGAAAEIADNRKNEKYHTLLSKHDFVPLALETLGPINSRGLDFIADLGRHLTQATDEVRETNFLFQRISITIQRFNAVAFAGTFTVPAKLSQDGR
jgi:Reverse transcriptase (RNA-dependent DNA polymerase)